MTIYRTEYAKGQRPVPIARADEVVAFRVSFTWPSGSAANDIVEVCPLPEDHVVDSFVADFDNLGATTTVDFGILNTAGTAIDTTAQSGGAAWLSAAATSAAGTAVPASTNIAVQRHQPISNNANGPGGRRMLGFKLNTAAATAATILGVTLRLRSANYGA